MLFIICIMIVMDWIYRLHERLALTKTETVALTALTGLFLSGMLIQHVWETEATVPDDYYAVTDSLFEVHAARLDKDAAARDELTGAPDTTDTLEESPSAESSIRMNLNTASARQFQQLSGIGPVLAERIIRYRKEHGRFTAVDDLVDVSGIGSKTLANIQDLLYVDGEDVDDP